MAGGVTIRDVALAAQVSVATVSRALNGQANVTDEVRRRVLEAAQQLQYSPHAAARSLSSRRTHAKRVARLKEMGFDDAAIARIRAPVGLSIEAETAPEIALSILAEIVAVRRGAALAAPKPGQQAAAAA